MRRTMNEFQEGDVVYLKSGGPAMTITELSENHISYCQWFDKNLELQGSSFNNRVLTKEDPRVINQDYNSPSGYSDQSYDPSE